LGEVKIPYDVIIRPHITERAVQASYGDPRIRDEKLLVRKYTFIVAKDANKIEIKAAIEAIYNEGKKKKDELIEVTSVRTMTMHGKKRTVGRRTPGYRPDRKKAIVTLKIGQMLEDYGV
jgi:large subunit ribosomal protein L23